MHFTNQNLCTLRRRAEAFVQLTNLLNVESLEKEAGAALAGDVLDTLTALLAGNSSSRARLAHDVGYDTLLRLLLRAAGPEGPQQPLLVKMMGPILEVRPDRDMHFRQEL